MMHKYEDLVAKARDIYYKSLELLERGDYYDAAEKGWCAVELARKALLVAVGVPLEKARNLEFSLPIFSRILKSLGRKDLLDEYYKFDSCLHIRGFYEMVSTPEEIKRVLNDLGKWLDDMEKIIKRISGINLDKALKIMEKCIKLKRKILQANIEYHAALNELSLIIKQTLSKEIR